MSYTFAVWFLGYSVLLTSLNQCKLVRNHIDWKESHGETMQYAIKTTVPLVGDRTDKSFLDDLSSQGLIYTSPCFYIEDCHIFTHTYHFANGSCSFSNTTCAPAVKANKEILHSKLDELDKVQWYAEIWERQRYKRRMYFNDPKYLEQWHLHENAYHRYPDKPLGPHTHLNLTGVWEHGVTGRNITVCVVDDGLEWDNPDLNPNYRAEGSIDLNGHDNDPMPDEQNEQIFDHNEHGTRCAGEIAAVANNSICGVGIAYEAYISGVRALDGSMTDLLERDAFAAKHSINDIYSCSWGPDDDGQTVDGPHTLAKASIRNGIMNGRNGYGSIYVVASGNGGVFEDNCNFDGYANSIYFVTIGAIDQRGKKPGYAEDCASMLAVTPSGETSTGIVTTDIRHRKDRNGCTSEHSGTSAAAPLAAGVIALVLSVNPCLTWRDIQHLIVLSSVQVDESDSDWIANSAGLNHSHKHGFGLMSAWNIVNAAKVWRQMPPMSSFSKDNIDVSEPIYVGSSRLFKYGISPDDLMQHALFTLEYIEVKVTISHQRRGNLIIQITCPHSGAVSTLASSRYRDESRKGFQDWTFSTVRCWGERSSGYVQLNITDIGQAGQYEHGRLERWSLVLHGSSLPYDLYQERIRQVRDSFSGEPIKSNEKIPCDPPPYDVTEYQSALPAKVLQVLVIVGVFLTIAAIFSFIEDLCTKSPASSSGNQTANSKSNANNSTSVSYNAKDMNIYLPINATDDIHEAANDDFTTQINISNSDNEDIEDTSDTTALLRSSG